MKKRSNIILILMIICIGIGIGLYADHLKDVIVPIPARVFNDVKIVKGEQFIREFHLTYKHLHVDYPAVSIDGRYKDHVELAGFVAASDMVDYEVCNDTLYIRYSEYTPKFVGRDAELAVGVHVGGEGLRSITVNGVGNVTIPIRPKGSGRDGKKVYKEEDVERYTMKFDTLDIINGPVDMLLDGNVLNIHKLNNHNTMFNLQGQVDHLDIKYIESGNMILNAYTLNSNTASVNADKNKDHLASGTLQFSVKDTLRANLYGVMDVKYLGDPEVIKYERSTGRVVHMHESAVF